MQLSTKILENKAFRLLLTALILPAILLLAGCSTSASSSSVVSEENSNTAPLSFDNLDVERVRQAAFKEVSGSLQNLEALESLFITTAGPSLSKDRIQSEFANLGIAANLWSDIWLPKKANIVYYTETDIDWVDDAACSKAGYCPSQQEAKISQRIKQESPFCSGAFADNSAKNGPFFAQCLGNGSDRQKNRQTGPHEYFHWVQFSAMNSKWSSVPNWFIEGSADYFGDAVASWTPDGMASFMDAMQHESSKNWMDQDICPLGVPNPQVIAQCFKIAEGNDSTAKSKAGWVMADLSFYMGSQATEAMLAVKGMNVFKQFLNELGKSDFDAAFKKHYGLTLEEFYPKVSKYVYEMYARDR